MALYAVHHGHGSGVYTSWDEARRAAQGVQGARCQSFEDRWGAEFFVANGRVPTFDEKREAVDRAHAETNEISSVDVIFRARARDRVVEWWDTASKSRLKVTPFIAGVESDAHQEVVTACRLLDRWATEVPLPTDTREIQLGFTRAGAYNVMTRYMREWQTRGWVDSRKRPVTIAGELEAACDASDSGRLPCAVHYRVAKVK